MWTEERVETLKKLWADGMSCSQIAGRIGAVTRNAVIGKAHRLGLAGRNQKIRPSRGRVTRRPPATRIREPAAPVTDTFASLTEMGAQDVSVKALILNWIFESGQRPGADRHPPVVAKIKFAALEAGMCKFPVGDPRDSEFGFCGQPIALGKPYCPSCCQRAYSPAKPPVKAPHHPKPNTAPASLKRLLQTA